MKHLALSGFDFLPIWKVRLTQRLPDLLSSSECFMCVWNSSPCYMPSFVEDAPGHLMMSDIQLMSSRSGRRQGPQMNLINGSKHPAVGKCKQRWYQVLLEHQKILHGGGTLWGGPWEVQRVTRWTEQVKQWCQDHGAWPIGTHLKRGWDRKQQAWPTFKVIFLRLQIQRHPNNRTVLQEPV